MVRRDYRFLYEFSFLLLRSVSGVAGALRCWLQSVVNYPPRVAVVRLSGVIEADDEVRARSGRTVEALDDDEAPSLSTALPDERPASRGQMRGEPTISLERCDRLLTRAFRARPRAVCVVINSPGGSPAQSSLIYQRLRALRAAHKRTPLLAFVEDAACSGGYYIACAADEIIADPNSQVGSIGVIMRSFGYVKALKRQGVTRRVLASGSSKAGIDPYLRTSSRDLASQRRLMREIHSNFVEAVKVGRGARLDAKAAARLSHRTQAERSILGSYSPLAYLTGSKLRSLVRDGAGLFDGSVYSGEAALEVGLVDQVGELKTEVRRRFGRHVVVEQVEEHESGVDLTRLLRGLLRL